MAQVTHIDGSITGLSFAEETSPGVLSVTPEWITLEPNSYDDFGGENTLVARRPINASRQRKRGTVVDKEASSGFETDLTYGRQNLQKLWAGVMCANFRLKGQEVVTAVDIDGGNPDEYEVASSAGFLVGSLIKGQGFALDSNNTVNVVTATTGTTVEVATGTLAAEASPPAGADITVVGHQFAAGDITVDVSGPLPRYISTVFDFTTLGLVPGEVIYVGGDASVNAYASDACNGQKRVRSISANEIAVDKSDLPMIADAGAAKEIRFYFGRVLKNEQAGLIVKKNFQMERTLGAPDDALPSQIQSEYVLGSMIDEAELVMDTADKIMVNWTMPGLTTEQRTGVVGLKSGTRPTLISEDAFNTSSNVSRVRLSLVVDGDESPNALFAYASEINMTVTNNLNANKAIGTLGSFSRTLGLFEVDVDLQAYLQDVTALMSVQNNDRVSLDFTLVKSNQGIAFDMPLGSLGDGRPDVENDTAVMIPLNFQSSEAVQVNPAYNHTLLVSFFDYLPNRAM